MVLAILAAALVGLAYKGIGERVYRTYLEETGAVVTGEVVGHRLYRCRGIRCAHKTVFEGAHGSRGFNAFMRTCRGRNHGGCHTDLVVRFAFGGRTVDIEGKVNKRDFRQIGAGSRIAVLVNRQDLESSLLRDHNPEGFLFWIALFNIAFVSLLAMVLLPSNRGRRRYARR